MHKIQKNVKVPKALRPRTSSRRKYPFEEMAVNDMFFVPDKDRNTLAPHASTVGRELKRKFTTRLLYMRQLKNGSWEQCEPTDTGANLGVGVWRVE